MGTIVLEQHCYASAPVGLKISRGFQTMARSVGLTEDALLEPHCAYQRPTSIREIHKMPVNWGWFWLDAERACLHRIGYAGTDEVGRPGNFMAHNLVVREQDLAAIDYDVPALLRWVSVKSPVRYPKSGDDQDGFARHPQHVYEHYSRERSRLGALPPLEVSVEAVRELRQEMDAGLETEVLEPLRTGLKKEVMAGIWRALVCVAEQRKTVLVLGAGNGADGSALERRTIEWLFALLPAHVRRRLTYSTYEHDPQGLLAPPRPGTKGGPHKDRRLYFATTLSEFRPPPGGAVGRVWIINAQTGVLQLPPATAVGNQLQEFMQDGKLDWLREFRELVSLFPFTDEAEGLLDGYKLFALTRKKQLKREDYPIYCRLAAMPGAPRRPAPALIEIGHRLLEQGDDVLGRDDTPKAELSESFVALLLSQLPQISATERAQLKPGLIQDVAQLFRWAVRPGWEKALRSLLVTFTREKALEEWRGPAQQALAQSLRTSVAPGDIERFLDVWNGVWDDCSGDGPARAALNEVGRALFNKLRQGDAANRAQFRRQPERALLGFLQRLPVADLAELPWRLQLLDEVNAGREPPLGELMLTGLMRGGGLPQSLVERLAESPTDVILRYYPSWYGAATQSWERLHGLICNADHLAVYGQASLEQQTGLHVGLDGWLQGIRKTGQLDDLARQIASAYLAQYARPLSAALAGDTTQRKLSVLTPLAQAHTTLLEFVLHYSEGQDRQQRLLLVLDHLLNLLANLATQEATATPGETGEPFTAPLRLCYRMFTRCSTRWDVLPQLLTRLRERRKGMEMARLPACAGGRFLAALASAGGSDEAGWYAEYFDQGTRHAELSPDPLTRKVCQRVLQKAPDLVDPLTPESEFAGFFINRLMDEESWRHAEKFVEGKLADPTIARALAESYKPLLLRLDSRGQLAGMAEALAERLAPTGSASLAAGLPYLALDLPEALLGSLRGRLNPVLEAGLHKLSSAMREPDRPVHDEDAEHLIQLLQAQRELGLPAANLSDRWQDFLDCFWCMPAQLCGWCFPALLALGEQIRQRGRSEQVPFWTYAFHPYLKGPSLRFARTLCACAESLLSQPRDVGRTPAGLKTLARLRREADTLESGFLGPPSRDDVRTDLLFVALCEFPEGIKTAGLATEEDVDDLLRRAQAAAAFYKSDEDSALARLAFYLGEDPPRHLPGRDDWDATRVTAIVILGYLLRDGRSLDDAHFQLNELLNSEFPRQLGGLLKKRSYQAVQQCAYWLCQMLCWCEFDEQTSEQWSKSLWKQMESKG